LRADAKAVLERELLVRAAAILASAYMIKSVTDTKMASGIERE
jgi:hypothetical protein